MKSLFSLFSNTPPFNHLMNMKKKDYPIVSFTSSSLRCAQKYSTNIYLWKMPPSPTNHGTFIWTNWHICHSHFSMWKILVRKYNTHCILRKVLGYKIIHHEICTEALFIAMKVKKYRPTFPNITTHLGRLPRYIFHIHF